MLDLHRRRALASVDQVVLTCSRFESRSTPSTERSVHFVSGSTETAAATTADATIFPVPTRSTYRAKGIHSARSANGMFTFVVCHSHYGY